MPEPRDQRHRRAARLARRAACPPAHAHAARGSRRPPLAGRQSHKNLRPSYNMPKARKPPTTIAWRRARTRRRARSSAARGRSRSAAALQHRPVLVPRQLVLLRLPKFYKTDIDIEALVVALFAITLASPRPPSFCTVPRDPMLRAWAPGAVGLDRSRRTRALVVLLPDDAAALLHLHLPAVHGLLRPRPPSPTRSATSSASTTRTSTPSATGTRR